MADDPLHTVTFKELKPAANDKGSNKQPYYRFSVMFTKRKDVTTDFFHQHWKTFHADLVMSARNVGVQVSRYVQFHADEELRPLFAGSGLTFSPYDGIAEFHAESPAHVKDLLSNVFADPAIIEDMGKFVDSSGINIMVGYENLIYGSGIKTSGGIDGILPEDSRLVRGDKHSEKSADSEG
ncbi:hypothetical protein P154DRAFT_522271 [Amniculicola lignicola CBS 123094]|uniref:EthD domain-containing protein n=1 Tax=Amniculicola lignicola CBS 123094 TaxID=1392246 RepID=A0A6A5WGV0_9PLEO|nr:hypothetical protein P154DRAFT_522271 [Amniculicola lignicola CBS 123094]